METIEEKELAPYLLEHYLKDAEHKWVAHKHGTTIDPLDRGATALEVSDLIDAVVAREEEEVRDRIVAALIKAARPEQPIPGLVNWERLKDVPLHKAIAIVERELGGD